MAENKRYYWLKLQEGFFEDETIRYIEEQENGIEYVNFYLKLCLKSLKNDGKLMRLVGETLIPYDVKSLSKLTGVDADTVRVAMALFEKIGLVKIFEGGEIYLAQIDELIGKETAKAKIMRAKRARELNGNNVTKMLPNCSEVLPECYTENRDKSIEIRDIENRDKSKGTKAKRFCKPTLDEVKNYIQETNLNVNAQYWYDYYESNGWMVGKNHMKDWKACIRRWNKTEMNNVKQSTNVTQSTRITKFDV